MKYNTLLFYLLIILLPVQLSKHFWPSFSYVLGLRIDYLSPTVYLTDIVIAFMFIYWLLTTTLKFKDSKFQSFKASKKVFGIWLLAILIGFCNIAFAQNTALAFFKTLKLVELAFIIFYIQQYQPSFRITVYCLLFTICYSSILAWLQFYHQGSLNGIAWFLGERTFTVSTPGIARIGIIGRELLRPYATFSHPNVLAGYLITTLPLIFVTNIKRHFKLPLILFIIATTVITFSRTAALTLMLCGFIYLLTKTPRKIALMFFGMLAIALFWIVPVINQSISFSAESFTIRNELNTAALAVWRDHPIFGIGLNNFVPLLPSYLRIDNFQSLQPVHNIYLLLLAETGLAGIFLLLWLSTKIVQRLISPASARDPANGGDDQIPNPCVVLSLCSIFFLSFFDHYFFTIQQTQLQLAVILGFVLHYSKKRTISKYE